MLPSLNKISTCQSASTQDTIEKWNQVLDYASTNPNATIRYHKSNMILMTYTYATYLILPEDRSRIAGNYYFTNLMLDYSKGNPTPTEWRNLKTVVSSLSESGTGGTIKNAQNAIPLRYIIETVYLYHQPTKGTPIATNNFTPQGILTSFVKPRKSKTLNMIYHWLEDRIFQKQIQLIWKQGICNWYDYFTK